MIGDGGWGKPLSASWGQTLPDNASKRSYETGYGKPPRQHQFKKGQSGNPKGRKSKSKNTTTLLAEELDRVVTVRDGESEKRITKREALITSLVNDAIKGKPSSRQLLLKLLDIAPPVEPFVANDDDTAAIEAFLVRSRLGTTEGESSVSDDDPPH